MARPVMPVAPVMSAVGMAACLILFLGYCSGRCPVDPEVWFCTRTRLLQ